MGKGDKKSRRGKIHIGTYGKRRRPNKSNVAKPVKAEVPAEKVVKLKKAAPAPEVAQPEVVAEVIEKPVKAKAKKSETAEAGEKKVVKKAAPKKAKETPAE